MYHLRGSNIALTFDTKNHCLSSLINLETGSELIAFPSVQPIFGLVVLDEINGTFNRRTVYPKCMAKCVSHDENKLILVYENMGDEQLDISCVLTINVGEEAVIHIHIDNNQRMPVVEVLCLIVDGIVMGQSNKDDYCLYPHHAGEKTQNPIEEYASERIQQLWRAQSCMVGSHYLREINYCGLASMTWMFYGDLREGLYIASHDDRFLLTGVIAGTGWPNRPAMCFGFREHNRIDKGESWNSGDIILRLGNGNWHWGAQRYRRWIEPLLQFDNNPVFLKDQYALNQCYNFKKDGGIINNFADIPSMFETGMKYEVSHILIASWNRKGFDCNYPEYYPDMELGTAMDLWRGVDKINKNGGFATFYINARLFDLESDFYKSLGQDMAIKNENQRILTEQYGPVKFSVNCPSDQMWQKLLIDTAVFTAKTYGFRGVYLDQLASAEPFACYDMKHSHSNIGGFNQGYIWILSEIKRQLKENNPDAFLMTENCGDIYGAYVWGNLTWNIQPFDEFFNMFKYTFPEYVQVNMVNPRRWIQDRAEQNRWFTRDIVRAVLLGGIFWVGLTSRFENDPERETLIKRVLAFRKSINSVIAKGRYCDDCGINIKAGAASASVWEFEGERTILIGNPDAEMVELDIELPSDMKPDWQCFDIETGELSLSPFDKGYSVQAKGGMLFAITFVSKSERKRY